MAPAAAGQASAETTPSSNGAPTAAPDAALTPPSARVVAHGSAGAPSNRPLPLTSALVPLKLGDAVVHLPLEGTTVELGRVRQAASESEQLDDEPASDAPGRHEVDLALVEERCRLKAASCRLFMEKRAAKQGSEAEVSARRRMDEMIARAKTMPNCFLWVFWRERTQPEDVWLRQIADCYDAHAEAVALMRKVDEGGDGAHSELEREALHLLAEANSALRAALAHTWLTDDDRDQVDVHIWLRQETARRRVYIGRHMTADDRADPANSADLRERIRRTASQLDEWAKRVKEVRSALGQIRYHAGQIVKKEPSESARDWAKIAEGVARLVDLGVPPSDRRISEAIGSQAALRWPSEANTNGLSVAIAGARGLSDDARAPGPSTDASSKREWSQEVLDVRARLRGKRIVIIGGERNATALKRLEEAFELSEAIWVVLTEHGTASPMRAPIRRPDTALVVVIIKLTGHLQADEAKELARAAGKPCVLLTGGYNPERVAAAILEQASDRLPAPSEASSV